MSNDGDQFYDVRGKVQGIFGESLGGIDGGLKQHNRVQSQLTKDGLVSEIACAGCGQPKQITFLWPELIAVRCGVSPYDAFVSHPQLRSFASRWRQAGPSDLRHLGEGEFWTPSEFRCARMSCGQPVEIWLTPDECGTYIVKGKRKGFLNQSQEVAIGNWCMNMKRGG
jgi:hypothetical protein